jgi:hypothetical protein
MHHTRINLLRLAGVSIEHLAWDEFIKRYDKAGTFFIATRRITKRRYIPVSIIKNLAFSVDRWFGNARRCRFPGSNGAAMHARGLYRNA